MYRLIASFIILAGLLRISIAHGQTDRAIRLDRTFLTPDTSDAAYAFDFPGTMIATEIPDELGDNFYISFWIKADYGSGVYDPPLGSEIVFDYKSIRFTLADFGAEDEWHFALIRVTTSGGIQGQLFLDIVTDGTPDQTDTGISSSNRLLGLGTVAVPNAGFFVKNPTPSNFVIDDIIYWENDASVPLSADEFRRFGASELDLTPSGFVNAYFSCDNDSTGRPTVIDDEPVGNLAIGIRTLPVATTFVDVIDKPQEGVRIDVTTAYGAATVFPNAGTDIEFLKNDEVTFSAPLFVYLDRFGNELGTSDDSDVNSFIDQSYYRAKLTGYKLDGNVTEFASTDERSFDYTLSDGIDVEWTWELEYAVIIDFETGDLEVGPDTGDPSIQIAGNANGFIGRNWVSGNGAISTSVDSSVLVGTNNDPNVRLTAIGYRFENTPDDSVGNYAVLSGSTGFIQSTSNMPVLNNSSDWTVEWWMKFEPTDLTNFQTIWAIYDSNNTGGDNARWSFRYEPDTSRFRVKQANNTHISFEGDFHDFDWHHWAVVMDVSEDTVRVYRDGKEIFSYVDSTNGVQRNNVDTFVLGNLIGLGSNVFNGQLDNFRIWEVALAEDQLEVASQTTNYIFGDSAPLPVIDLTFDDAIDPYDSINDNITIYYDSPASAIDTSATYTVTFEEISSHFPSGADSSVFEKALLPTFELFSDDGLGVDRISPGAVTVEDWLKIIYSWDKEYRISVSTVLAAETNETPALDAMPFVVAATGENEDNIEQIPGELEWWIREDTSIRIGTQYRTDDRCFTMNDQLNQSGLFLDFNDSDLIDGTYDGAVTREYQVASVANAGSTIWQYGKTLFRAEIPLGQALDFSSTSALNAQIVPNLCDGGELSINQAPSLSNSLDDLQLSSGGRSGTISDPVFWDAYGQQFLPLRPGEYTYEWQDKNNGESYFIHIATDFPQNTKDISWEREDDDGVRELLSGNYVTQITMADVTETFPGAPSANYRYFYHADTNKQSPVELDANDSDRIYLHGTGFSAGPITFDDNSKTIRATGTSRTSMLYSYREDVGVAANGDIFSEKFMVRVAESVSVGSALSNDTTLSDGERQALYADSTTGGRIQVEMVDDFVPDPMDPTLMADRRLHLNSAAPFTVAFWAKLDDLAVQDNTQDRIAFEYLSNNGQSIAIGFRGPDHATDPNALFFDFYSQAGTGDLGQSNSADITVDQNWHHYAYVNDAGVAKLYMDGILVLENDTNAPYVFSTGITAKHTLGNSTGLATSGDYSLNGWMDNINIIGQALTSTEIQDLMLGIEYPVSTDNLLQFTFDDSSLISGAVITNEGDVVANGDLINLDSTGFSSLSVLSDTDPALIIFAAGPGLVNPMLLDPSGDFTIAFRVTLDTLADAASVTDRVAFSYADELFFTGLVIGFRGPGHPTDPGKLFLDVYQDINLGVVGQSFTVTGVNIDQQTQHYTMVNDGAMGEARLYLNGSLIYTTGPLTYTGDPTIFPNHALGRSTFIPGSNLIGSIDDYWRIDGALSEAQIQEVIDGTFTPTTMLDPIDLVTTITVNDVFLKFTFDDPTNIVGSTIQNEGSFGAFGALEDASRTPVDGQALLTDEQSVDGRSVVLDQDADFYTEVATRVYSKLDTAGFGSGYTVNEVSNYNPSIYNRAEGVGNWGSIYPVNWSGLYTDDSTNTLRIAYYENPFLVIPVTQTDPLHPNVAWPWIAVDYDEVDYPAFGPHADKRIYISSRLGTEGVDVNSNDQLVFDSSLYQNLTVYNQPYPTQTGYNPNEEHAFVAESIKALLTGNTDFDLNQNAAFALQKDLNVDDQSDASTYTSDAWVLTQYGDVSLGETVMSAYKVEAERSGTGLFPALDDDTHLPTNSLGEPVTQPSNPAYQFNYAYFAGDLLIPPYPINIVIGAAIVDETSGGNLLNALGQEQRTIWNDVNGFTWCVSGEGRFFQRYWYPFRSDFWYESGTRDGINDIAVGTPFAWLPEADTSGDYEFLNINQTDSVPVNYDTYWRTDYPVLKRGETLTYPGGEYAAENPGAEGLPGAVAWAAGQIVFDTANPDMFFDKNSLPQYSARFVRSLDLYVVDFALEDLPTQLRPAATDNVMTVGERYYFKGLTGSLQKRLYYNSLTNQLIFRGRLNDYESGDPQVTSTPISLYVLEPNVMTAIEYDEITDDWLTDDIGLGGSDLFRAAVESLYELSQNPTTILVDDENPADDDSSNHTGHVFLSGMQAIDFTEEDKNGDRYITAQPLSYNDNYELFPASYNADPDASDMDLTIDGIVTNSDADSFIWSPSSLPGGIYYSTAVSDYTNLDMIVVTYPNKSVSVIIDDEYTTLTDVVGGVTLILKASLDPDVVPTKLDLNLTQDILVDLGEGTGLFNKIIVNNSNYSWVNISGTDVYYATDSLGGDPGFPANIFDTLSEAGENGFSTKTLTRVSIADPAGLLVDQWTYMDANSLGFETIYLRLSKDPLLLGSSSDEYVVTINGAELNRNFARTQRKLGRNQVQTRAVTLNSSTGDITSDISDDNFDGDIIAIDSNTLDDLDTLGVDDTVPVFWGSTELVYNATLTALQPGQFGIGDLDGVGFDTYYVRLPVDQYNVNAIDVTDLSDLTVLKALYGDYQHLNSLGAGGALTPKPQLLTAASNRPRYITLFENNNAAIDSAITLHVIEIGTDRYRGGIKLIEGQDVFDEKVNVAHTGDFGANTEEIYYQWYVRDVASIESIGLPGQSIGDENFDSEWQLYTQGLGLHSIKFKGRPDISLADKFFYVRYGEKDEIESAANDSGTSLGNNTSTNTVSDETWRLVDINDTRDTYTADDSPNNRVPFQWAGAANSPQLQANGSFRFLPQLIMGWVKRVLDRVNPYEARFSDFFNNESPSIFSSQLQIAGAPFIGPVALNSDKDVIENVGLIELYETVLKRAKDLTLEVNNASDGTDMALLLAATRLAFLYELFALEAYSDKQDSVIAIGDEIFDTKLSPYVHAFYNQEASLLHEELALLRGIDFLKAYPVYNRLFWNYVKGEGEAAYNSTYQIFDVDADGFINEFDAAELYPQGHGDAWGHFLSAEKMHYELLRDPAFDWQRRSEFYALLDNLLEVDYLDERTFSRIAAEKAQTGLEIVQSTYRLSYTEDPDGQWQGYKDTDTARAWGVSEWGKRATHGALFDWAVGNALVPRNADDAAGSDVENLDTLDRVANRLELGRIAQAIYGLQTTLDEAGQGLNPLGLDSDAVVFDIEPARFNPAFGSAKVTHFEQVFEKAVLAGLNAYAALEIAHDANTKIRHVVNDTNELKKAALLQDLEFRNRLIDIFGRPYNGVVGPGQPYDEGYEGPDNLLYRYIDRINPSSVIPTNDGTGNITIVSNEFANMAADFVERSQSIYDGNAWRVTPFSLTDDFAAVDAVFEAFRLDDQSYGAINNVSYNAPVLVETDEYAFQAPSEWGARPAYGKIQAALEELLLRQIEFERAEGAYLAWRKSVIDKAQRLEYELNVNINRVGITDNADTIRIGLRGFRLALNGITQVADFFGKSAIRASLNAADSNPRAAGLAFDISAPIRAAIYSLAGVATTTRDSFVLFNRRLEKLTDNLLTITTALYDRSQIRLEYYTDMLDLAEELSVLQNAGDVFLDDVGITLQALVQQEQEIQSLIAEGFRIMEERELKNIYMAEAAQQNRYSDMIYRISRNEALSKYENAFNFALQYAWLAAKAYDYETGLSEGDAFAASGLLEELIRTRQLGYWNEGEPSIGQGGLAEILAKMKINFEHLKGQLGINNPQDETGLISMRHELFRIASDNEFSDERWEQALAAHYVENLWDDPVYRKYCRPLGTPADGAAPAFVIPFSTEINNRLNVFGRQLGSEDHAYSISNFATKINSVGVWFENYEDAALSTSPRVYLVPAGSDVMRVSNSNFPEVRAWDVVEQTIPAPFALNNNDLSEPSYVPSLQTVNESFAEIKRFADFRAYPSPTGTSFDSDQLTTDSRLIGRSVWNTRWVLIIPASTLHSDDDFAIGEFVENVSDIQIFFQTYAQSGI
ncbi:LamG domain-containing protein [Rubellicoccus peritrichatus]|uniref:LamG domain-containing protein n=1 Tax=Rubellicoccus peritrichatus TaxID=3080537 RepID=A0AAQ3L9A0_9BACT|nr:LamG domain-containing protein [Puniceicoccus sp. CR14]WOO41007.1 LamG domain-containing protein [Puniceicoccus sp. CR14]